jgi:hypothetical protein
MISGGGHRKARTVILIMACALAAVPVYLFDPVEVCVFPPCPVHWIFRVYCPGCGTLRAFHNMLHGRIAEGFRMNPGMIVLLPVLLCLLLKPEWAGKAWVAWAIFAFLVLYCIARNLPFHPFCLLAPH